jgi:hypothetical protein
MIRPALTNSHRRTTSDGGIHLNHLPRKAGNDALSGSTEAPHEVQKHGLLVRSAAGMGRFFSQHVLVNIRDDLGSKVTDFTLQLNELIKPGRSSK